ncbi:hypothetical protein [Sporolactobacillus nakayamae]|uniref:hypothetical protein n=1 Tax=Sporolactobacillus nakayamae TaxID=269670 RepID=UPI000B8714F2|nr:hypothetical protein [Sporolactobacillus nakayamae]
MIDWQYHSARVGMGFLVLVDSGLASGHANPLILAFDANGLHRNVLSDRFFGFTTKCGEKGLWGKELYG